MINNFFIKILFFILFFGFSTYASANTDVSVYEFETEKQIKSSLALMQAELISSNFIQKKYINLNGKTFIAKGKMVISSSHGLCWKIIEPFSKNWIFGADGIIEIDKNGNKKIVDSSADPMIKMLINIMSQMVQGNYTDLEKQFGISQEKLDNETILYLTPKSDLLKKVISNIKIEVFNGLIKYIKILEKSNSYTELIFEESKKQDSLNVNFEEFCNDVE
ncbi:MAG: outer membrane lipoprotein carrier protein LolA [Succinivibrionaceae bacterium]